MSAWLKWPSSSQVNVLCIHEKSEHTLLQEHKQSLISVMAHCRAGSATQHCWAQDRYCLTRESALVTKTRRQWDAVKSLGRVKGCWCCCLHWSPPSNFAPDMTASHVVIFLPLCTHQSRLRLLYPPSASQLIYHVLICLQGGTTTFSLAIEQLGINGLIQLPLHVVYCIAGPF